jgi:hypothetical protein
MIALFITLLRKWKKNLRVYEGLLRPYCSWLDTHSPAAMADAGEISPADTAPAMISASLSALPLPYPFCLLPFYFCLHSDWSDRHLSCRFMIGISYDIRVAGAHDALF